MESERTREGKEAHGGKGRRVASGTDGGRAGRAGKVIVGGRGGGGAEELCHLEGRAIGLANTRTSSSGNSVFGVEHYIGLRHCFLRIRQVMGVYGGEGVKGRLNTA